MSECDEKMLFQIQSSPYVFERVGEGCVWEQLPTTAKHLSSTYSKIKGNFLLKALKFKHLKYAGENTEIRLYLNAEMHIPRLYCCTLLPCISKHKKAYIHERPSYIHVYLYKLQ